MSEKVIDIYCSNKEAARAARLRAKVYLVKPNDAVPAPAWWAAARAAEDAPRALRGLLLCTSKEVEISWDVLQWCKTLPDWQWIDGHPLRIWRIA